MRIKLFFTGLSHKREKVNWKANPRDLGEIVILRSLYVSVTALCIYTSVPIYLYEYKTMNSKYRKKCITKRQIRRRIESKIQYFKKSLQEAKCDVPSTSNVDPVIVSDVELISNVPENENCNSSQLVLNNLHPVFETQTLTDDHRLRCFNFDPIHSSDTGQILYPKNQEKTNAELQLQENLRKWACKYDSKVTAVTDLLHTLHPLLPFLPLDYRTLMGSPRTTTTYKLHNGDMLYFGIKRNILRKLRMGLKTDNKTIKLQINIDGLPLFKSSAVEIWPILALSKNFRDSSPFTIGIFCGKGKPDPLEVFLRDFLNEFEILKKDKIEFEGIFYELLIDCFICDAPARSFLRKTAGHTSKVACEKCHIKGKYQNHRINFAEKTVVGHKKKLDTDFTNTIDASDYIKGKSPLVVAGFNLITQFPLDPMHLLYLGIVKRLLLNYFVDGRGAYKLSQSLLSQIDVRISSLIPYVSADFARKPRSFKEMRRWKATEFRLLILYTGPVLLYDIIATKYYHHFLLLHCAVFILSSSELIEKFMNVAEKCVELFVQDASKLYGDDFVVFNVHSLLHLADDVKLYGNINNFTCFPFENYLGSLKRKVHSPNHPLSQLHRRIEEDDSTIKTLEEVDIPTPIRIFKEIFDINQLVSYSCEALHLSNYFISITQPNNCVIIGGNKVVIIKSINFCNNIYVFEALRFQFQSDLYETPLKSSDLNIYYVKKLSNNNILSFNLDDIKFKCMILPYKSGFAVFPINHLL